jgi:hypothetical protein
MLSPCLFFVYKVIHNSLSSSDSLSSDFRLCLYISNQFLFALGLNVLPNVESGVLVPRLVTENLEK